MTTLADLHPAIQCAVLKLSNPALSFEQIGSARGISRQAAHQLCSKGLLYLQAYSPGSERDGAQATAPKEKRAEHSCRACARGAEVITQLKLSLVLAGVRVQLLRFFRSQVLKFFPRFKATRLPPEEKKQILDWFAKFKREGGLIKNFASEVGRSPETLARWQEAYDKHGLAGLADKTTRPKHFGNKVPLWVRDQLVLLFFQFPRWTPYQYHSYIRHNPTTHWYVSLPVIQRLKDIHMQRTAEEKERIAKRWCFSPGTDAWTVDFTCILKTNHFKLQCLTVSDQRSRFLLHSALYINTSTEAVIGDLAELFIKYGKPLVIKADNGPEFRMEFREGLRDLSVYLLNSPDYYGQFNGAHERIHRTMKAFIDPFRSHQNITRLVAELAAFQDEYNYKMPMDSLDGKTPSEIFLGDSTFTPKSAEVVTPYEKDGELRVKFTSRDGALARMSMPVIEPAVSGAASSAAPDTAGSITVVSETPLATRPYGV